MIEFSRLPLDTMFVEVFAPGLTPLRVRTGEDTSEIVVSDQCGFSKDGLPKKMDAETKVQPVGISGINKKMTFSKFSEIGTGFSFVLIMESANVVSPVLVKLGRNKIVYYAEPEGKSRRRYEQPIDPDAPVQMICFCGE